MEIEILSGRFIVGDTVAARGDFNGWGRTDLIPDPSDPNFYITQTPFADTLDVGDTIYYKFFYTPDTWEGGDNRPVAITQEIYNAGQVLISRPFNDGTLATVTNQPTEVLFQVDCNNAESSCNFLPIPDVTTVHIAGGTSPLQWPSLGWPDNEIGDMIEMYDDGATGGDVTAGDLIFTTTVIFPAFTTFEVQYKFGINYGLGPVATGCDTNFNDNENAIGDNHIINLFSSAWYVETLDTFGIMGLKDFVTEVEDITETLPTVYSLNQNYPNPFNPATMINFSIPKEEFVTLNVYNSIGQKVATLVNESKSAGTYQVDFNAANLSSGIYLYKITAGNFIETKKMILMK
jgi:hypothetical protein